MQASLLTAAGSMPRVHSAFSTLWQLFCLWHAQLGPHSCGSSTGGEKTHCQHRRRTQDDRSASLHAREVGLTSKLWSSD